MWFLVDYINVKVFLISLIVAFLWVYLFTPSPKVVVQYPTPENAGKITYNDKHNKSCYKYETKKVSCNKTAIPIKIN